jgi:hypothetical protein
MNLAETPSIEEPPPVDESPKLNKFCQTNQHLHISELMRLIISQISLIMDVYRCKKALNPMATSEDPTIWDSIYPKGKDGLPSFNPSGKYAVKLFHMGAWRKVTIDDRIPINADGKPLFISSPNQNEIWPMLITKAICKISSQGSREYEVGDDINIVQMITGMVPEKFSVPVSVTEKHYELFRSIICKPPNRGVTPTSANVSHKTNSPDKNSASANVNVQALQRLPLITMQKFLGNVTLHARLIDIKDSSDPIEYRIAKVKYYNCFPTADQPFSEQFTTLKDLCSKFE